MFERLIPNLVGSFLHRGPQNECGPTISNLKVPRQPTRLPEERLIPTHAIKDPVHWLQCLVYDSRHYLRSVSMVFVSLSSSRTQSFGGAGVADISEAWLAVDHEGAASEI